MYQKLISVLLFIGMLSGCATTPSTPGPEYNAFYAAKPASILVVPIVNHSLDVDAPNYMLSTLTIPLAERGYYVFPVNTVKVVLEQEGFYEADIVHAQNSVALAELFDADAVMYVVINRWDAQYAVFSTTVTVDFSYRMVSRQGVEIWSANRQMVYTPQNNNNSGNPLADLLTAAVQAAITKAVPNFMPLTEQANNIVIDTIPPGPYMPVR
ncbi:MAG: hypothetical protein CSA49_01230 [Gammaproteobacteria bacterium]|nr:MAG: hypothetical protein CSA49_01230 [Gammaproteobacteria bacterium]